MKRSINLIVIVLLLLSCVSCNKVSKEPDGPNNPDNPSYPVVINKLNVTASDAKKITLSSAEVAGAYEIEPVTIKVDEVGFMYGTDEDLREYSEVKSVDNGGEFWCTINDLKHGIEYYWRAYVKVGDTIKKSSILSFSTFDDVVVNTNSVTNIGSTSVSCGGKIVDDGGADIFERGVCYSKNENPTISNKKVVSPFTSSTYSCDLTGLTRNTTYYVRAYVVNEVGTYYGNQVMFNTLDDSPIDYIENGINLGESIPVCGNWDDDAATPYTLLHWAPVNCGCKAEGDVNTENDKRLGILYQWGYGDASLYDGKANASYYSGSYLNGSKWYDYNTITGSSTDKWNNNQGPCPDGWRLPTRVEFKALCAGKNGRYGWVAVGSTSNYAEQKNIYAGAEFFGANIPTTPGTGVFFPAAGYRNDSNGSANFIGERGYYWSSTPNTSNASNAYNLDFNSSSLDPQYSSNRAYGFSVRCVHDPL